MKTIALDYNAVHSTPIKNSYWDGWTLVLLKKNPSAYTQKNAVFHNGTWHVVVDRVGPDSDGLWHVRSNYVNKR